MPILLSEKDVEALSEWWLEAPEEVDWAETLLRAQLKRVVKWQERKCTRHPEVNAYDEGTHYNRRRDCPLCQQALKKEAGL